MRKLLVLCSFWLCVATLGAQNAERKLYSVAFYNLENLFEITDAARAGPRSVADLGEAGRFRGADPGCSRPEKQAAEVEPPGNAGLRTRRVGKCECGASRSQHSALRWLKG